MGKYILGTLFLVLMALNVAAYVYLIRDLDGSTVTTKHSPVQPQQR